MAIHLTQEWPKYSYFFLIVGTCISLSLPQACTKSSTRSPSSAISDQSKQPSSHTHVEKQLLKTMEHAENLGKGNPLVLSSLYSLASYYRSQGQYDKAEVQYKKALQLKEELSGPDHPDLVAILENYADLLREAKRYTEAENLSSRAAGILANSSSNSSSSPRPH